MKRLFSALLFLVCSAANAQFVTGQILTAAQLNAAFANVLATSGGTLTGPLTVQGNTTLANLTVSGTFTVPGGFSPGSLSPQAANSLLGNASGTTQAPGVVAVPTCSASGNALKWTSASGFTCGTGNALTANPLSQFAATTSAQLASVISDETGSGSAVFGTSPTLTGTPTAPTPAQFDNSTKLATSAFVQRALGSYSGVAGFNSNTTLTLAQIGNAIDWFGPSGGVLTLPSGGTIPAGNAITFYNYGAGTLIVQVAGGSDFIYSGTVTTTTSITLQKGDNLVLVGRGSNEIDVAEGTASLQFYSTLGATPGPGDNSTKLATTAFVATSFAPLASPTFTGTPAAPTATAGTSTTQLATTAFAQTAVTGGGNAGTFTTLKGNSLAKVFATNTSGQSIPNSANTTITGWTTVRDANTNFVASTGIFTAPATADYLVCAQLVTSGAGISNGVLNMSFIANAATWATANSPVAATTVTDNTVSGCADIFVNSGQTIVLQLLQNSGGAQPLATTAKQLYLSIVQLP
jgi:hypothetical protein